MKQVLNEPLVKAYHFVERLLFAGPITSLSYKKPPIDCKWVRNIEKKQIGPLQK
jgi:hypothetical protein